MPHKSRKKADRNCSGAKGSEAFFSSFLGLQVPVSQNRLKRSKSPKKEQRENVSIFHSFQNDRRAFYSIHQS